MVIHPRFQDPARIGPAQSNSIRSILPKAQETWATVRMIVRIAAKAVVRMYQERATRLAAAGERGFRLASPWRVDLGWFVRGAGVFRDAEAGPPGHCKHQALSTTRRRGRRGPVGRCDGRDRKRWNPIRSPRAVVFPELRGGSSSAAFRPLAMTIVAGESGLW